MSPLLLLTAAVGLFWPAAIAAETYDPPVTTLVTNMEQSSGSNSSVTLYSGQTGFDQRFRTGPNPAGYQLQCIWLYVGDTHESRYMTINARVYRVSGDKYDQVAVLSRDRLDDRADNEWQAPADTYLEPNTVYAFELDCVRGCANDNYAFLATTRSQNEDSGAEAGWSIGNSLIFRKAQNSGWFIDLSQALQIRGKGRPSPHRAYRTEIVSSPRDGDTYRLGENIEIALTYNSPVYVAPGDPTAIDIRVGDAEDGSVHRTATYASGQFTSRPVC